MAVPHESRRREQRVDPAISAGGVRTVGARWLIALILLGFGIAHVIGATVLDASRAPATDTQGLQE